MVPGARPSVLGVAFDIDPGPGGGNRDGLLSETYGHGADEPSALLEAYRTCSLQESLGQCRA